ncbi:hypothetical protein K523DRAFT_413635 [Schizophyllum commune Tattone D]|nr:hypothetical protein K523DRAFT_413635 [Schizophyllum commune Tattone D]
MFPFSTDDEVRSEKRDMKRLTELGSGDESRHDAGNMSSTFDSQAVATPTRERQNMRAAAFKSEPKNLSPFLDGSTPAASFSSLPPEVLHEIFNHCDPLSLVQLTKTSIILRDMLLECSQSIIRLWKQRYTAHTGYELPPAADDISLPRLACLIMDETCSLCNTARGNKKAPMIIWNARIRCCKRCLYGSNRLIFEESLTTFKAIRDVRRLLRPAGFRPHEFFPGVSASNGVYTLFMLEPVERFVKEYERFIEDNERECMTETKTEQEEKNKTKEEKTKTKAEKKAWKEEKKAWVARKAAEFAKIRKHAHICKQWEARIHAQEKAREQAAQAELKAREQAVRTERLKGILQRLNSLGLEAEVRHAANWDAFRMHPVVTKPKELTEEAWTHIRDPLLQFIIDLRENRLAHERRETLRQRYTALDKVYTTYLDEQTGPERYNASLDRFEGSAARCLLPQIGDLVRFEEVVDLIEGTPVEQPLTEETMRALIDRLAHAPTDALGQTRFDAWRAGCEAELVALLMAADPTRSASDLHLAAMVFSRVDDAVGQQHLQYPAVLGPRPGTDCRDGYPTRRDRYPTHRAGVLSSAKADAMTPAQVLAQTAWSAGLLTVEPARIWLAEQVIKVAGLDPRRAMPAEMDVRGAWVALESAMDGSGGTYRAMMWRYAMLTCDCVGLRSPEDVSKAKFVLLSNEDAAEAHEKAAHAWPGLGHADLPKPHNYQRDKARKPGVL